MKTDFTKRAIVSLVAAPIGIGAIVLGGAYFVILVGVLSAIAAWEFTKLFKAGGFTPSGFLLIAQVVGFIVLRAWIGFESDSWLIPLVILSNLLYAIYLHVNEDENAAIAFVIMTTGALYIGYLNSFYVSIRALSQGEWWTFLALFPIWLADSGAYLFGSLWGKHKLAPRLSPKKTWEGYFGGIASAVIFVPLLVMSFENWGFEGLPIWKSALFAFIISALSVFGDFGVSIIKRQFDMKDSGTILPGHGGLLDRMDTWLWSAAISYFIIASFLA